jgi:hypothetical protein
MRRREFIAGLWSVAVLADCGAGDAKPVIGWLDVRPRGTAE